MKKILFVLLAFVSLACNEIRYQAVDTESFKAELDGKTIELYTLSSENCITAQFTNYGARVVSLLVPDRQGKMADVVLGCETAQRYLDEADARFYGPVVGRYANRIAAGRFLLDGKEYTLAQNDNGQSLHGGVKGFDSVIWTVDEVSESSVSMHYFSPDGEEGYPGNLTVYVTYRVEGSSLKIEYKAETDSPTVVNLSNHSLFNLAGEGNGDVLAQELWIAADATTPVDEFLIPSGEIASVDGTPFDFRTPTAIGARINENNAQLANGHGYDHNWVLNDWSGDVRLVASLYDPASGRKMEIFTDQPGLQFYSGNFFNENSLGKYSRKIDLHGAVALETQHFPDSPNHPDFPSTLLRPGENYTQTCIYSFAIN